MPARRKLPLVTRRKLPLTLAVVGGLIILAVIVAASVVRSSDTATLSLGERPEVPVVITEPGVLDAVDPEVTARATAGEDEQVVLAVGRTSEVEAWLGSTDHARITGLSSWEELRVEVVTGTEPTADATATPQPTPTEQEEATTPPAEDVEEPQALPDPAGSDLWVAEATSTGTAELTWSDQPGRWTLVAATDGSGPAPEVELEWGRQVSTPWLVPGIVIGGLLLVAGATMLVLDVLARREQRRRDDARARAADTGYSVSITDTDPGTGQRLTRRQIREMEREMALAERGDTTAPGVPPAGPDEAAAGAYGEGDETAADVHAATATPDADARTATPDSSAGTAATEDAAADGPEEAAGDTAPADDPAGEEGHPPADDATGGEAPGDTHPDPATEDEDVTTAPEDTGTPTPPSWRSVWGFGGASVERDGHDHHDHDDDQDEREERR